MEVYLFLKVIYLEVIEPHNNTLGNKNEYKSPHSCPHSNTVTVNTLFSFTSFFL